MLKEAFGHWQDFCASLNRWACVHANKIYVLPKPLLLFSVFLWCSVCDPGHMYSSSDGYSPWLDVFLLFCGHVHVLLCPLADVRLRYAALRHVSTTSIHANSLVVKWHFMVYFHVKVRSHLPLFGKFSQTKYSDFNRNRCDCEFCMKAKDFPAQILQRFHNRQLTSFPHEISLMWPHL